jgi:DNA-binding LacI/PurR family transcriptional regulator
MSDPMLTSAGKQTGIPIYESLAERLRGSIREGRYAPGDLIGSEHELARRESISRMTVRKASELLITEGLLERRPGKGLYVRGKVPVIHGGMVQVVGNMLWPTSLEMARGVQAAVKGDGIHVQLYDAHGDVELDLEMIENLPMTNAHGAVIVALHHPRFSQAICRLHATEFPFVLLDQRMRDIDVSCVTSDNHQGGYLAGELLARHGHKRVAFIGDLMAATVQDRLMGLRDALGDADIPFRRSMVVDLAVGADRFGDWGACISAGVRRLLDDANRPTAIVCSCDAVARQVYRDLANAGLRVPDDMSVVGYDDDAHILDLLTPGLTTIRQPFSELGRAAMELLKVRIGSPSSAAEARVLPVELVERASVAPPRGA